MNKSYLEIEQVLSLHFCFAYIVLLFNLSLYFVEFYCNFVLILHYFLAIVIVTYNGDNSKGIAARKGVERVAQYLRDQGY